MLQTFALHAPAFGLDISDFSLKIVQLKRGNKSIASFGEFSIPQGVIVQGEIKKQDELVRVLKDALKRVRGARLETNRVIASLPEERAFLQMIQLPLLKKEEVAGAIRFQAEKYIPYALENVYLDHEIADPLVNHINHRDVLLASIPRQVADSYLETLLQANLTPLAFEVESLAVCRSLVEGGISPIPVFLLDLGATRTGLVAFAGKSPVFTASIPISSSQLTDAVARHMRTDARTAEALKMRYGIAAVEGERASIATAMTPLLNQLAGHIKRYAEYYASHSDHQHLAKDLGGIQKIILCGGGSMLKGLPEFLSRELAMAVELGNPWVNVLSQPIKKLPPLSLQESLRYTTAIGLSLRGIA